MFEVIMLLYLIWAIYCGWKFMDGRIEFLERKGIVYKIIKLICVIVVGYIYGAIYIIILILRFLGIMSRM